VVRLALLAAMLCGCAQLLGLDETSGGGPEPTSLTIQRVSIGARVTYAPQDLAASKGTYLVPSGADPTGLTRVVAAQAEPGRWTAPITGATPILFDLPDYPKPLLRIFDFPRAEVKALFGVMEHPDPQPAPAGAMITVNATLDAAYTGAERFELYTLGSWNSIPLTPPAVGTLGPIAQTFAFTAMTSITGRPHERITSQDSVVALRYVGNELRGALRAAPFDQTGTDTIAGTMAGVTLQPFTFGIDPVDATRRYGGVRPLVGTPVLQWSLRAAPGAQLNNDNGPLLAAATLAAPAMMVTSQAGNPFEADWPSTLTWSTQASRTYTPPSAGLQATLVAGMSERVPFAPGLQLKLPAGLPTRIALGDMMLDGDGATLSKPVSAIEVSFTTDLAANTLYQLQLFKLVPNAANTALVLELKLGANGAAPRFVLPPELFETGALYTLRAIAIQGGFPSIDAGDLTQRSIPLATSFLDSGVFQVTP
jgi:hypothetical protein